MNDLPLPPFYEARNASEWSYRPDEERLRAAASSWRREHGLGGVRADGRTTHLLIVDPQKDFCHPAGSLYVAGHDRGGAVADAERLAAFIYRNLASLTDVTCTLDTHLPHQIFFPAFWVDREGGDVDPHRIVTSEDLERGELRPVPGLASALGLPGDEWLREHAGHYCRELERAGRFELYLWPPHCLLGSEGHTILGMVQEARLFHAFVHGRPANVEIKGLDPLTEFYSALGPEVATSFDGTSLVARPGRLGERLLAADRIVVAGQAASHCVRCTLLDLAALLAARRPDLLGRVYILRDCTSSVVVRDAAGGVLADFSGDSEAAFRECGRRGMRVVTSDVPMEEWE